MKPTYVIKGWDDHFETAESRKLKGTRWVPMPTKHDGKGYRRVAQHKDAVSIFCGWNLIVQVASKMPARGTLADEDGPLDAEDLAAMTGFPAETFTVALEFLSSDRIGWIVIENQPKRRQPARTRQNPPEPAAIHSISSPEGKGTEQNRKELNSTEENEESADAPFSSPEFEQAMSDLEKHRKEIRHKITPETRREMYAKFMRWGEEKSIRAIREAIGNGWRGVFEPKANGNGSHQPKSKVDRSMDAVNSVLAEQEARRNAVN